MDYQKIYEAVKIIKEVCEKQTGAVPCQKCPLGSDEGVCSIASDSAPSDWNIIDPETIRVIKR